MLVVVVISLIVVGTGVVEVVDVVVAVVVVDVVSMLYYEIRNLC